MSEESMIELKAKAYDVLSRIEQLQGILRNINIQILELSKQEQAPVEEPIKE